MIISISSFIVCILFSIFLSLMFGVNLELHIALDKTCFVLTHVFLKTNVSFLLLFHKFSVFIFQFFILVSPNISFITSPVVFIIVHVLFESYLPAWHEINLPHNLVWNIGQVKQNNYEIRLFSSNHDLFGNHVAIFVQLIFFSIFYELLSFSYISSDIIEFIRILWIL